MKLVYAIVQNKDANLLAKKFSENGIRATKLASTGGFLSEGNTTFIIGIADEKVADVMKVIKENCHQREEFVSPVVNSHAGELTQPVQIKVGGAIVFVTPVDEFRRF
ncbi:cyclic-di-AMP receptor [Lactobacillus psittaci]|uniref:Uncharacterized protein n=1 Tax=Lactobacillus psittaci DSM 15354 TaxID=1122152 RepID=A0A0R1S1Q4_9LACO|nr:cyclic-di-AMP receptor [Lactobacillus psittaci]KRL63101.1 hypothetical protein FC23_GL001040 [Lactobacillus psittaci DSM 15354]